MSIWRKISFFFTLFFLFSISVWILHQGIEYLLIKLTVYILMSFLLYCYFLYLKTKMKAVDALTCFRSLAFPTCLKFFCKSQSNYFGWSFYTGISLNTEKRFLDLQTIVEEMNARKTKNKINKILQMSHYSILKRGVSHINFYRTLSKL